MKTEKLFYSELAYVLGIITLAIGTALMERADFGMSMVVAPAYLLHLKISQFLPFYSFGMSEYVFQAVLLILLSLILHRFKKSYLLSFVTAVIYGITLDMSIQLIGLLPMPALLWRFVFFFVGMLFCAIGVSLFFHTYILPEAYELFVKEISAKSGANINKVKTIYDCCSCFAAILLSFAFFGFGHFEGVKAGTIFCALINGWLIGRVSSTLEANFVFRDILPWRDKFNRDILPWRDKFNM